MPQEHSAGAVNSRKRIAARYLIFHYEEGHWGSSKGHTVKDETDEQTARRGIREETGLTAVRFIPAFRETNCYSFMGSKGPVDKSATFLLAESGTSEISLSDEQVTAAWLPFETALKRITFSSERDIFAKAHHKFISLGE